MNKLLFPAAAAAGLLAVAAVAATMLQGQALALGITLLIGVAYAAGLRELQRFDAATQGLQAALADAQATPPAALEAWLPQLPAPLREAVRARVAGERVPLPGPALTPYLVGLLVLLGMLGTFGGMVATLHGTGLALERANDFNALRDSLAAPVRGLGLAFGTSVAGVATSALLGGVSALVRRRRQDAGRALDAGVAGVLAPLNPAHQLAREQARERAEQRAQDEAQQQAAAERLVASLDGLAARLEQQAQAAQAQLQAEQQRFHAGAEGAYRTLAASVAQALEHSLAEAARSATATLQPAAEATLAGMARQSTALQAQVAAAVQQQLEGLAQQFERQSGAWVDALGAQMQQQGQALLLGLDDAQARQQAQRAQADAEQRAHAAAAQEALAAQLAQVAARVGEQAEVQSARTIAAVTELMHTAGEAPRAAAALVAELRDKLSASLAQDNALLDERSRIMATLNTLLGAVQHTATEQKAAIDALVAASARWLDEAGARFTEKMQADGERLEAVGTQLAASAVEVASLGEAFGGAVAQFGQAGGEMLAQLQRVEQALERSATRSDEQLAYYVAQAREVIDLSLHAQKQIVDGLQGLQPLPRPALADAA